MSALLNPNPSDRVALKIWDSLTVTKLQLDLLRRSGIRAGQSARFDVISRELEALAFHVRQLLAHESPDEIVIPTDLSTHSDTPH